LADLGAGQLAMTAGHGPAAAGVTSRSASTSVDLRDPSRLITDAHARVRALYGPDIGRERDELSTPALLLNLETLRANLALMAAGMRDVATTLRAHVKVHKSPHIARLQVEHGAIGVGCATVWEAIVMARAGIDDVFVINEIVGVEKTRALALLAREAHVKVAVDDLVQIDQLSRAAVAADSTIGVFIDVDEGMHRCGVTSAEEALPLARRISEADGLDFVGLTGYEGHCSLEFDRPKRVAMAREAMGTLTAISAGLAAEGLPCRIVSAAGTGTWEVTSRYPGVTEIQPGSYATMDGHHRGLDPRFGWAVSVLATVISRRHDRIVLDTGSKTVGASHGVLRDRDLEPYRFDEEHSIFNADRSTPLSTGDTVEILCNYTPFAISYFEAYHVLEGGRVVDIWPVLPRGPESRWLLDMLERGE
jgi:D-serine deaminase-like pyridoxal phosphate-dependent protein